MVPLGKQEPHFVYIQPLHPHPQAEIFEVWMYVARLEQVSVLWLVVLWTAANKPFSCVSEFAFEFRMPFCRRRYFPIASDGVTRGT